MFAININKKAFKKLQTLNSKQKQTIEQIIFILKNDQYPSKKPASANSEASTAHTG